MLHKKANEVVVTIESLTVQLKKPATDMDLYFYKKKLDSIQRGWLPVGTLSKGVDLLILLMLRLFFVFELLVTLHIEIKLLQYFDHISGR